MGIMSGSNGTCDYIFDPDNPETWGGEEEEDCRINDRYLNENGVWECPYDAEEDEDKCIFHKEVESKDDDDVMEKFLKTIKRDNDVNNSESKEHHYLGAKFGYFNLGAELSEINIEGGPLSLLYVQFSGQADFSNIVFGDGTNFRGAKFGDCTQFVEAEFGDETIFAEAEFGDETSFSGSTFGFMNNFSSAKFGDETTFSGTEFGNMTLFSEAEFGNETNFNADFGDVNDFTRSKFGDNTNFNWANFGNYSLFKEARFCDGTDFTGAKFGEQTMFNNANFGDNTKFRHAKFDNVTKFVNVMFGDDTSFIKAKFDDDTNFDGTKFDGSIDFREARLGPNPSFVNTEFNAYASFKKTNLTDAVLIELQLHNADFEQALMSRSTLFGTDLRGAKLNGAVLGNARINKRTRFLGHPDDDTESSPHTFSAIRSKARCVYDPNYDGNNNECDVEKAKSVYRSLEELAGKAALPRLQSQCFVRRQDLQKDSYKQDAIDADSWEERLIAASRYIRAKGARATLLYGESPWRIVGISGGFILMMGVIYPLFGWLQPRGEDTNPITWSRILGGEPYLLLESIYFSALTFTTLGMGDYIPVGGGGQALVTLNTAFGAILLALLVFVLGRRAAR